MTTVLVAIPRFPSFWVLARRRDSGSVVVSFRVVWGCHTLRLVVFGSRAVRVFVICRSFTVVPFEAVLGGGCLRWVMVSVFVRVSGVVREVLLRAYQGYLSLNELTRLVLLWWQDLLELSSRLVFLLRLTRRLAVVSGLYLLVPCFITIKAFFG